MFDTTKSRGRDKGTHKTKTPTASTIVLPSKALGQLHDTLSFHGSINDAHQSIPLITPIKQKAEPKLSRSAIRRRSILAAEEAYEAANAIPVLEDFPRPLPPTIVSRTYHETIVSIRLIDDASLPASDYKECDYQLQVSKGGKQLDNLRPSASTTSDNRKHNRQKEEAIPLAETKLKWSTIKRVPASIPKQLGTQYRVFRLVGSYNVIEKCAFRCRIRYAEQGWSRWSRVSLVQIPVESGLPDACGRAIAFARTKTSLEIKWPAPRREILEYYVELAICRKTDNIPVYDMEDEVREEDLPSEEENDSDNEDDEVRRRILNASKNTNSNVPKNPIGAAQRKVSKLDWIAASHECPITNEMTLMHLQPTESYRFRVRARNRVGWGPFGKSSDTYKLAPNPPGTPLQPRLLEGSITPRTFTLRWNEPR